MLFSYNQLIQAIPSPVFLLLQLLLLVIVDTTATLALYIVGQYCMRIRKRLFFAISMIS